MDSIWRTRAQLLMANVTNASKCSQVTAITRVCLESAKRARHRTVVLVQLKN